MPEHRQDEASCPRRLAREYYAEMMEMRRRALAAEEECREAEREISELMAAKEREEAEARRHWRYMSEGCLLYVARSAESVFDRASAPTVHGFQRCGDKAQLTERNINN